MVIKRSTFIIMIFVISFMSGSSSLFAKNRFYHFNVAYQTVSFAGKPVKAMGINGRIPGPTLHFRQGDIVTIVLDNHLDQETAIHWHGLLVPWQMDGVLGVSQQGIPPGHAFTYHFKVMQSGTYWYHAHAGLQEQQGLYGALLIDAPKAVKQSHVKDFTMVLSDWSNTHADQILRNLKKEGDYYSPNFPLQPSLLKFIHDYRQADASERAQLWDDYRMMQHMRMSIYDISDVAYDAFLLNGHTDAKPWMARVRVGDTVRLRFIGAMGSTIYHIKIPNQSMQLVNVEGNNVKPINLDELTLAPGETYDVLLSVTKDQPIYVYAESADQVGSVAGVLLTSPKQVPDIHSIAPFPEPKPATRAMMGDMSGMSMASHGMDMPMPMQNSLYEKLQAAVPTNNPSKPIAETLHMSLNGYMDKYIWFINGVPEYLAKPIILQPNKRYRFVMRNDSMMHHPMHLHGHWFIVRVGRGRFDPLLHTIDVSPGTTITADVDTDASGQWLFHCHLLYHMMSGMARVFQYSTLLTLDQGKAKPQDDTHSTQFVNRPIVRVDEVRPINPHLVSHPMAHEHPWWSASSLDVGVDPFHNAQEVTFKELLGSDFHKLELYTKEAEIEQGTVESADMDAFYWQLIDQFWAVKAGMNYTYRPSAQPYWQPGVGIEGLMPYFINADVRLYDYAGTQKLDVDLERDTQITNNFFIRLEVEGVLGSNTNTRGEIGSGLNDVRYTFRPFYRVSPGWTVYVQYEYQKNTGTFRKMQLADGVSSTQHAIMLGVTALL